MGVGMEGPEGCAREESQHFRVMLNANPHPHPLFGFKRGSVEVTQKDRWEATEAMTMAKACYPAPCSQELLDRKDIPPTPTDICSQSFSRSSLLGCAYLLFVATQASHFDKAAVEDKAIGPESGNSIHLVPDPLPISWKPAQ
jgi:hypothetical protein